MHASLSVCPLKIGVNIERIEPPSWWMGKGIGIGIGRIFATKGYSIKRGHPERLACIPSLSIRKQGGLLSFFLFKYAKLRVLRGAMLEKEKE